MNKILFVIMVAVVMLSMTTYAYAEKSPYESGASHAKSDCKGSHDDMYILEEGKGPAFHTQAFMDGYYSGWKQAGCSTQELNDILYPEVYSDETNYNTAIDDSNFDDHSVSQPQQQTATTSQNAGCPQMVLNGNCIIGQDQNTENTFGQANRADN